MIFELFSKRKKKIEKSGLVDVYQYDNVPKTLRVQVQQVLVDAIGPEYVIDSFTTHTPKHNPSSWKDINKTLCRELGVHRLANKSTKAAEVLDYIGQANTEEFIDAVELCVRYLDIEIRHYQDYDQKKLGIIQSPQKAVDEINYRFREVCFGYQFENGEAFRVDSQFVHEEAIKPALKILNGLGFEGPKAEFLQAHRNYRSGEYEQAIVEAAKSFESTLRATCDLNRWEYENNARATDLLKVVRKYGLWPDYLDKSFDQLVATLASGLPKVRNDTAAHGQGAEVRTTPAYIAGYALHLCAAKIVLIAEAQKSNRSG
jgi:AbiJ N-terminal domain 4